MCGNTERQEVIQSCDVFMLCLNYIRTPTRQLRHGFNKFDDLKKEKKLWQFSLYFRGTASVLGDPADQSVVSNLLRHILKSPPLPGTEASTQEPPEGARY